MHIRKSAFLGAGLGLLVGLVYTVITLLQFDRTQYATRDLVIAGFAIAVPVATVGGFLAGLAWQLLFRNE